MDNISFTKPIRVNAYNVITVDAAALKKQEDEERARRMAPFIPSVHDLAGGDFVKMWTVVLNGETTSIVFHRQKFEVVCNGMAVETTITRNTNDFGPAGTTISFVIADKHAQISSCTSERAGADLKYELTIDGNCVPSTNPDYDLGERF